MPIATLACLGDNFTCAAPISNVGIRLAETAGREYTGIAMQQLLRWQAIVDLLVLTGGIYIVLRWAQRARALRIVLTLLFLHAGSLLASHFEMIITSWVLEAAAITTLVVLVLAFQAEVRYAVMRVDNIGRLRSRPASQSSASSSMIAEAAFALAARRIGSLLVIVRRDPIAELVHDGFVMGAEISTELLEAIFQKGSPLHDGAAILEGGRISRAGAFLPLTQRLDVPPYFGTRHRAAIGLGERCDALVVVTSEERGEVTLVDGREVQKIADSLQLASALEVPGRRSDHRFGSGVRRVFLSNLGSKAAALAIAAAIWSISVLLAGTTVRSMSVPVEFSDVPAGMEVSSQSADQVEAQLRGNAWLMDSLSISRLVVRVDLSGAAPGTESIRVTPGDFNLPPGIVVDRVFPPSIKVSVARGQETTAR
jgi:diadenylate cyclase